MFHESHYLKVGYQPFLFTVIQLTVEVQLEAPVERLRRIRVLVVTPLQVTVRIDVRDAAFAADVLEVANRQAAVQICHLRVGPHKRTQVLVLVTIEDDCQLEVPEPPRDVIENRAGHLEAGVAAHVVHQRKHRGQLADVSRGRVALHQVLEILQRDAVLQRELGVLLDHRAAQDVRLFRVVAVLLRLSHAV